MLDCFGRGQKVGWLVASASETLMAAVQPVDCELML